MKKIMLIGFVRIAMNDSDKNATQGMQEKLLKDHEIIYKTAVKQH